MIDIFKGAKMGYEDKKPPPSKKLPPSAEAKKCIENLMWVADALANLPGPPTVKQLAAVAALVAATQGCRMVFPNHKKPPPPPPPGYGHNGLPIK